MLLGGPQNTFKSHLVFTALFCFAPFSVFSSHMSAPYCRSIVATPTEIIVGMFSGVHSIVVIDLWEDDRGQEGVEFEQVEQAGVTDGKH
jgi:hypothetical protein